MKNNFIKINNTTISKYALTKVVKKKIKKFDTFSIKNTQLDIENNSISIKLSIEFNQKLKTYKPIVDMIEAEIFNAVFYFSTIEPSIQIRIN